MSRIIFEKDKCIGCGVCASICPNFWEMDKDNKAELNGGVQKEDGITELEIENAECNTNASQSCPVQCIKVE